MAFQFDPLKFSGSSGVYIFRDYESRPLYVGKAIDLRQRIASYFQGSVRLLPRTRLMVDRIQKIETIQTQTEFEALLLEADLIKRLKPKYNIAWKDDKRYLYIKVSNFNSRDSKEWPWVTTARKKEDDGAVFFGPFPESRIVRRVLRSLRKVFPWCKYKNVKVANRARVGKRGCFYYQIGLCPGICAGKIKLEEYQEIIANLVEVLSGKSEGLIKRWQQEMQQAAKAEDFERAVRYRDLVQKLAYVTQSFHDPSEYLRNPNLSEDQRLQELRVLKEELGLFFPFAARRPLSNFRIEAYDISNIGDSFAVGAGVVFVGGQPQKNEYRRYKIRLDQEELPNDVAALREVILRRFGGAAKKVTSLPDLLVVDGGKPQAGAVLSVLAKLRIEVPVIALAKKEEQIIIPLKKDTKSLNYRYQELNLSKESPALILLTRLRNEAHRFAVSYHRKLRQKSMVAS